MSRRGTEFETIRSEGGLLPTDLLRRVLDPTEKLPGTAAEDYGLPQGERLTEVITPAWNRLRKHWSEFRVAAASLPDGEPGTGLTNDKFSLPLLRELGFGLLPASAGPELGGRVFAINRFFGPVPVHLIGCGLNLDRRVAGMRGAAAANPHGLVQEFLNRSHEHLWGVVGNGLRLRILRDSQALSRQSFLEFDLESMFTGEVYSDFVLLWLVGHATRFAPREAGRPDSCWLELWTKEAEERGTRALGDLRLGVERALQILGQGFTSHPSNIILRDSLRSGEVSLTAFYGQLLRVIYRLLFLCVAEDRDIDGQPLLHPPDASEVSRDARERYSAYYSTARLRELAGSIRGSRHTDLWRQLKVIVGALSGVAESSSARDKLALPVLGSFLWEPGSTGALNNCELTNYDFLEALRHLAFTRHGEMLRSVDFKNLGADELGGVYESLLALTPQISADGAQFTFAEFAGNERQTSGSYYTPDGLVQCLLDSALDPIVAQAIEGKTGVAAENAILSLKVCDPAVGSGHFLVGAAHRLARHLSRVRARTHGESEPSTILYQHALREVIGRCLYGVDVNPMAAELCRVSLWLEALDPGKPLSFLDHRIRVGNSLLGVTPDLIVNGLPDEAFAALDGDDKKACAVLKKRNKVEREGMGPLFATQDAEMQLRLRQAAAALEELPDDRPEEVRAKEQAFLTHELSDEYRVRKLLADAWCAAFFIQKRLTSSGFAVGITQQVIAQLADRENRAENAALRTDIEQLAKNFGFFHWHLAFPEVFARGGFDVVLGNPPWDVLQFKEEEHFAHSAPEIAARKGAKRKKAIEALRNENPAAWQAFRNALRATNATSLFIRGSGRYPLSAFGKLNLYALFSELSIRLKNDNARSALIVPADILSSEATKTLFRYLIDNGMLLSSFAFENEEFIFPGIANVNRFVLVTFGASNPKRDVFEFVFFVRQLGQLADRARYVSLNKTDFSLLNPNTRTCPTFRTSYDVELTRQIYNRVPVLVDDSKADSGNPWTLTFTSMFNMTTDSGSFLSRNALRELGAVAERGGWRSAEAGFYVPLYEGKFVWFYDYRFSSYHNIGKVKGRGGRGLPPVTVDEYSNARFMIEPQYWVNETEVEAQLAPFDWKYEWLLCWRDVSSSKLERTLVPSVMPRYGAGHTLTLFFSTRTPVEIACLLANLSSIPLDYIARQKTAGTHLTQVSLKQFPVLPPDSYTRADVAFILPRVVELTYTGDAMRSFARDLGYDGSPFLWSPERRARLNAELDAYYAQLYGLSREELRYILDPADLFGSAFPSETFRVLKERELKEFGEYRTARLALEAWDALNS